MWSLIGLSYNSHIALFTSFTSIPKIGMGLLKTRIIFYSVKGIPFLGFEAKRDYVE